MKASKGYRRNDTGRGKPKYADKIYLNATVYTTHFTWTDLGSNRRLRDESPTRNHLNHGTATCFSSQEVK